MYVFIYVFIYEYMYVYMYVCMYVYVCMQSNALPTELFDIFCLFLSRITQLQQCVHLLLYSSVGKRNDHEQALIET